MDPASDFQKRMVEYLEGVHLGEFITGTMDEVKATIEKNTSSSDYSDPTQTLPVPPPSPCMKHKDGLDNGCPKCNKLKSWWNMFKHCVDDLVFHSNVHSCSKYGFSNNPNDKKDQRSCINKQGKCKARFPRPLFDETQVDPNTGALNVKKGEQWINTFTPIVTFLYRCNSDVTSLLSGTAIKAIVAYVTDYISKPGLKTYTIFDTIRTVFDRNSELLGGSLKRQEKARSLITKIINALTAKIEIGGPMAALYLLGNPDHYTSHKFIPVYWKNYVREVLNSWVSPDECEIVSEPERVVLQRKNHRIIGLSTVHDYVFRPEIYINVSLYEWMQCAKRIKMPTKSRPHDEVRSDDELDFLQAEIITSVPKIVKHPPQNIDTINDLYMETDVDELNIRSDAQDDDLFDDSCNDSVDGNDNTDLIMNHFLRGHPLHETHYAQVDERKKKAVVPNFVGGSLPRRDRGDREYYCATMLTLFQPWRTGLDLKQANESWDDAFIAHNFTARQLQIIDNFNIRYECNDARDDYSTQLKKDDNGFPKFMTSEFLSDLDQDYMQNGDDFGNEDDAQLNDNDYGENKYLVLGQHGRIIQAQMDATENIVRNIGWLDKCPDEQIQVDYNPVTPELIQNCIKWKTAVQSKRQEILAYRSHNITKNKSNHFYPDPNENSVMIIDQSYLEYSFRAQQASRQEKIDFIPRQFSLNTEQERAFRIIANHSSSSSFKQLKMYIGGMAGTGKSQVIKALVNFFESLNEAHRFVILGPTGTSAALLNGSTYHYFLGINPNSSSRNEATVIANVKGRLEGADYIFLDEVSMLSCHDMYKISSRLAKAMNVYDVPYGGLNMIFAGDFAQLPPVGGAPLYSGTVGTQINSALTLHAQESAIGKALWHQVNTVVILRENMRQNTQSSADSQLRTALVNMRYGKCTPDDIKFLRSRIAGRQPGQPNVASSNFRNVPIICGLHSQKDQINYLGCQRFASDTNQKLINFYSIDKWGKERDSVSKSKPFTKLKSKAQHISSEIDFDDQRDIWKVRPGATEHFPGKLSLCLGMPIMLRNNDATELCMTKGQEAFVAGWQSYTAEHGKRVIDTLFLELDHPSKVVKIPGLPENVVPIVMSTKTIQCMFPSDLKESIERQQVWVLPNFAMTAHASQGKTRLYNVVHLNSCFSHMSYYTCLSRSATAAGTVIIQGFDPKMITRGCNGYLRQEFREQEILDDITRFKYEKQLPTHIEGSFRYILIQQYQLWKGSHYIPPKVDSALIWSSDDPLEIPVVVGDSWQIISKGKGQIMPIPALSGFVSAKGTISVSPSKKHTMQTPEPPSKRLRTIKSPLGLTWDNNDWSCAYDSLLVILYDLWQSDITAWTLIMQDMNEHTRLLCKGFSDVLTYHSTFEQLRDHWRSTLHCKDPDAYPYGPVGISVADLVLELFKINNGQSSYMLFANSTVTQSTSAWVDSFSQQNSMLCPPLLVLEYPLKNIITSHLLNFHTPGGSRSLSLKGIVYHGDYHFTSCIISTGRVWYHDGMTTGSSCVSHGLLSKVGDMQLRQCKGKDLVLAIYTLTM
jgi:hypothetical protein